MDRMSQVDVEVADATHGSGLTGATDFPDDGRILEQTASKDPGVSELVKEALATTGKLWKRLPVTEATGTELDKRHVFCPNECELARAKQSVRKQKPTHRANEREPCQSGAYHTWDASKVEAWWRALANSKEHRQKSKRSC